MPRNSVYKNKQKRWQRAALAESNIYRKLVWFIAGYVNQGLAKALASEDKKNTMITRQSSKSEGFQVTK